MKTRDIKTIEVIAKEWFDKINGNSYFSAKIYINYGLKNAKELNIPFTYGYGDHYRYLAFNLIKKELKCFKNIDKMDSYSRAYEKYNIKYYHSKKENCLKRDLINS